MRHKLFIVLSLVAVMFTGCGGGDNSENDRPLKDVHVELSDSYKEVAKNAHKTADDAQEKYEEVMSEGAELEKEFRGEN